MKMDIMRNIIGGGAEAIEEIRYFLIYCPYCFNQIEFDSDDINITNKVVCDSCKLEILIDWGNREYWAYQDINHK